MLVKGGPGVRILRVNGCLTGILQAGTLVFLCAFGIREDGLHRYLITLKRIRNQIKPRPGKEPRLIFKLLAVISAVYIVIMGFCVLFLFSGLIPNTFSHYYREVFTPSVQSDTMYQVYTFSTSPFLVAIGAGSGMAQSILVASVIMVRREITVFCKNLEQFEPRLMKSQFLDELRREHESLLTLVSTTSNIFSPFYSFSIACRLTSAVFLGFNTFYPNFEPMSFVYFEVDVLSLVVLTAVAIYNNAGVSQRSYILLANKKQKSLLIYI